jgi:hypothetical protein
MKNNDADIYFYIKRVKKQDVYAYAMFNSFELDTHIFYTHDIIC